MPKLANRAQVDTATTGTGTLTLGAATAGFQTFAAAGVADAEQVAYLIEDGDAWEIGLGTYTATGTTLTRTVTESSNAGAALNLSGNATVSVIIRSQDFGAMAAMAEATAAQVRAWTASALGLTTQRIRDAFAPVVISGAANWTPDWGAFNTANWAVTANRTINNPSTVLVGETKYTFIKSSSTTARTISWGSYYKGNLPDITVTNSNYILVSMTAESATSIVVSFVEIGGA